MKIKDFVEGVLLVVSVGIILTLGGLFVRDQIRKERESTFQTNPVSLPTLPPIEIVPAAPGPDLFTLKPAPAPADDDGMPTKLRIGPYNWHVSWLNHDQMLGAIGETTLKGQRIIVRTDIGPGFRREVLLHEIVHACIFVQTNTIHNDFSGDGAEDLFIESSTSCLLQVMQDNPKLVDWLRRPNK